MTKRQVLVVQLYYAEDLSVEEISAVMDLRPSVIRETLTTVRRMAAEIMTR